MDYASRFQTGRLLEQNTPHPSAPHSFPPLGKHPTATGSKNSSYMGPEGPRLSTTSVSPKPNYKDLYGDLS